MCHVTSNMTAYTLPHKRNEEMKRIGKVLREWEEGRKWKVGTQHSAAGFGICYIIGPACGCKYGGVH